MTTMKRHYTLHFTIVLSLFLGACSKESPVAPAEDYTTNPPSGAVLKTTVVKNTGSTVEFEADIVLFDGSSHSITSRKSKDFNILSKWSHDILNGVTSRDSVFLRFAQSEFSTNYMQEEQPYSAVLLLDQSGSILSTDPRNARIDAATTFLGAVDSTDYVLLSAFSQGGRLKHEPVTYWGSFTSDGSSFYEAAQSLKNLIGGGTPLYLSAYSMTSFLADSAPTPNKALILFTDGQDTEGHLNPDDVIDHANLLGVKIFTVGLGDGTDRTLLGMIAHQTSGAFMQTSDAQQLISFYGSLGNILRGRAYFYRIRWTVSRSNGIFAPGTSLITSVIVSLPKSLTLQIPLYIEL